MAEPHLDHPGEVSWFPGKGPAAVLGSCPHTGCPHDQVACIAWGPDFEHYTLEECRVPAAVGGCDGTCRSWAKEIPRPRGGVQYGWAPYLHVQVPPRGAEPDTDLVPTVAPIVAAEPAEQAPLLLESLRAAELGPEFLEAIRDRRDSYLADLHRQGISLAAEERQCFELGWENAVAAVAAEVALRHWILVESPLRSETAGG